VDADDVALGQIRALEQGAPANRYILCSENLLWRQIVDKLADAFGVKAPQRMLRPAVVMPAAAMLSWISRAIPGFNPVITPEAVRQVSRTYRYSNEKARRELSMQFRPFSDTASRLAVALGR
jgi:nucleoside-diphosphate-sugar epimerase